MFKRRKKVQRNIFQRNISEQCEYRDIIELINSYCEGISDVSERILFLNYALDTIRNDLIATYYAKQFYKKNVVDDVFDFRIAIIFEIVRLICENKNNQLIE